MYAYYMKAYYTIKKVGLIMKNFKKRLATMLANARAFGFDQCQAESLERGILETWAQDRAEARKLLTFWEKEFAALLEVQAVREAA